MGYIWKVINVAGFGDDKKFTNPEKVKEFIWKEWLSPLVNQLEESFRKIIEYMPDGRGKAAVDFLKTLFISPSSITKEFCKEAEKKIGFVDKADGGVIFYGEESEPIWYGSIDENYIAMDLGWEFRFSTDLHSFPNGNHGVWFDLNTEADESEYCDYEFHIDNEYKWGSSAYPLLVLKVLDEKPRTIDNIIQRIKWEFGATIERKSVGRHLKLLQKVGFEVKKKGGYYIEPKKEVPPITQEQIDDEEYFDDSYLFEEDDD